MKLKYTIPILLTLSIITAIFSYNMSVILSAIMFAVLKLKSKQICELK